MAVSTPAEMLLQLIVQPASGTTLKEVHPDAVSIPYTLGQMVLNRHVCPFQRHHKNDQDASTQPYQNREDKLL